MLNETAGISSPMRSSELTEPSALLEVVSHTAFKWSRSGGLEGESFSENTRGEDFVDQGAIELVGAMSAY